MSRIAKDNNINIKIDRLYIYIIKNKKRKNNFQLFARCYKKRLKQIMSKYPFEAFF